MYFEFVYDQGKICLLKEDKCNVDQLLPSRFAWDSSKLSFSTSFISRMNLNKHNFDGVPFNDRVIDWQQHAIHVTFCKRCGFPFPY